MRSSGLSWGISTILDSTVRQCRRVPILPSAQLWQPDAVAATRIRVERAREFTFNSFQYADWE